MLPGTMPQRMRISRDNLILGLLTLASAGVCAYQIRRGESGYLESVAFITGVLGVWLTVKENIWNWPIGIVSSAIYIVVFWNTGLFADGGLNVYYVILGFTGWYMWLFGGEKHTGVVIVDTPAWEYPILAVVTVAGTWALTIFLAKHDDSAPFWDALTSVISVVAQYMVTRKYIQNWHLWIVVDIIYVRLYIFKHLQLTAVLYAIFIVMAFLGLRSWILLRRQLEAAEAT